MPGVTTAYQTGIHSARPAASAGCILYSCTTHGLAYRSDGTSWTTFLTLPSGSTSASPSLTLSTSASAGAASTFVATDATIPIFDATVPSTQAFSDAAATGSAAFAARRDHKHAMPATPAGSSFSGARAYHNTTQSPTSGTVTVCSLNAEDFDSASYHDTVTNNSRLTVPTTGKYLVIGHVSFTGAGPNIIGLKVNGSATSERGSQTQMAAGASSTGALQTSAILNLTAADYVEMWMYQTGTSATGSASIVENMNSLSIVFLGA